MRRSKTRRSARRRRLRRHRMPRSRRHRRRISRHQSQPHHPPGRRVALCAEAFVSRERPCAWTGGGCARKCFVTIP